MSSAPLRRRLGVAVLVIAVVPALAGCGGEGKKVAKVSQPRTDAPTESVTPPTGVTLTKPGTQLGFGKAADIGFTPNAQRSTTLQMSVTKVLRGSIADLAAYRLDSQSRASTPYYVQVTVKNLGPGKVGHSAIPLWGLASDDSLIGASGFTNAFPTCPSSTLPTPFATGASTSTCLMYLVPKGDTLTGVSYRPVMADEGIVWKGAVITAQQQRAAAKKAAQKKKNKKKASS